MLLEFEIRSEFLMNRLWRFPYKHSLQVITSLISKLVINYNVNKNSPSCLWISKHKPIDKLIEWSSLQVRGPRTIWRVKTACQVAVITQLNIPFKWRYFIDLRKKKSIFLMILSRMRKTLLIPSWDLLFWIVFFFGLFQSPVHHLKKTWTWIVFIELTRAEK